MATEVTLDMQRRKMPLSTRVRVNRENLPSLTAMVYCNLKSWKDILRIAGSHGIVTIATLVNNLEHQNPAPSREHMAIDEANYSFVCYCIRNNWLTVVTPLINAS